MGRKAKQTKNDAVLTNVMLIAAEVAVLSCNIHCNALVQPTSIKIMENVNFTLFKWCDCATLALPMKSNASPRVNVSTMPHSNDETYNVSGSISVGLKQLGKNRQKQPINRVFLANCNPNDDFLYFCIRKTTEMDFVVIEYNLVLIGWVVAILLGTVLLLVKVPHDKGHVTYRRAKNTCAITILLFGLEILFQWLIRFYLDLHDPALSVSVYLFTYCVAALMFAAGFCTMLAPSLLVKKQRVIAVSIAIIYGTYLLINYFVSNHRRQTIGILIACVALFIITCFSIYKCVVIYRRVIKDLKTYYSDVVENLLRWMPGVGVGVTLFLITAPITCLCPRWVGVYQLALGIILFIYTFISTIEFSFSYNTVAAAIQQPDEAMELSDPQCDSEDSKKGRASSLSTSLQEIMQDKESRWCEQGGYRTAGLTIDQAARAMGTNRSYLSRYLNEVRNMTFYEWVATMRIQEAQSILLNERDATIEQVASRVGFSSLSTFSSTFKKMVGESPVKWRNQKDI